MSSFSSSNKTKIGLKLLAFSEKVDGGEGLLE